MSELYEGVVFLSTEAIARQAFEVLAPPFRVCLVRLPAGAFGVYRVADRSTKFEFEATCGLAAQLSESAAAALAVFYDNRSGVCAGGLYRAGELVQEFGEDDELWVPCDDEGEPRRDCPPIPPSEMDEDQEYDCIRDAIAAGLSKLEVPEEVSGDVLKDAFSYDRAEILAEAC